VNAPYLRIGDARVRDREAVEFMADDGQGSCVFVVPREVLEDLEQVESLDRANKLLDAFNRHRTAFSGAAARHFERGGRVVLTMRHVVPGHRNVTSS
jgi:hypothetical protein